MSLVLALATLFTSQRAKAADDREHIADPRKAQARQALVLDKALFVLTLGLFVAGAPIAIEAAGMLELFRVAGAIRLAFVVVWILLIGLLVWQLTIIRTDADQRKRFPD